MKLKVMHHLEKDGNGNATIKSIVTNPPKLREAIDSQQAAEEHGHLPPIPKVKGHAKVEKPKPKPSPKGELSEDEVKVLEALNKLGGTSESMPIAKHLVWDKKYPKGPKGHVRNAMKQLSESHLVTSKREGVKYTFSITAKGSECLANPLKHQDKKEGSAPVNPLAPLARR